MRISTQFRIMHEFKRQIDGRPTESEAVAREHDVSGFVDDRCRKMERARLFRSYPLILAHEAELCRPGDFVTSHVDGLPILITRADDGEVRAFLNVCRHRGNLVCTEAVGSRRSFRCGYHAWMYDNRGRCLSLGNDKEFAGARLIELGLTPLPVELRHGLVWLTPRRGAVPSVREHLGAELDEELGAISRAGVRVYAQRKDSMRFNWKLGVETFLEVSHISSLHRDSIASGFLRGIMWHDSIGRHQRLSAARAAIAAMYEKPEDKWRLLPNATLIYFIFPNTIYIHQQDHIEMFSFIPNPYRVDRCEVRTYLLTPLGEVADRAVRHWEKNWNIIEKAVYLEDFCIAERVQVAISAGGAEKFLTGTGEIGIQVFHDTIRRELAVD